MEFPEYVRSQFPLRPSHPDWERLVEVVQIVEKIKADGLSAEAVYNGFVDVYSASYLAINRAGVTLAGEQPNIPKEPEKLFKLIVEQMSNAWVEGLFFGIYFERLGGHRNEDDGSPAQEMGG